MQNKTGSDTTNKEGQAVVEMAVVLPVMLAMALILGNIMAFLEASARFDRLVPDIIMAVAVSPQGDGRAYGQNQAQAVKEALDSAMGGLWHVSTEVRTQEAWSADSNGVAGFNFAPHLTRYVCTMTFTPWPHALNLGFINTQTPLCLEHSRAFTVDTYKPGVVF